MASWRYVLLLVAATLPLTAAATAETAPPRPAVLPQSLDGDALREILVRQVTQHAEEAARAHSVPALDPRVLDAIGRVPRHVFVPRELAAFAYVDMPLPVAAGQNTAQPYLVALMTTLAEIGPSDVVFETGTGAGYHAAVLSLLARRVHSVEVIAPLAERAGRLLREHGYENVETHAADGYYGWAAGGPYDAIIVKEAIDHLPGPLIHQLKPGGRLVAPMGPADGPQALTIVRKDTAGRLERRAILPVRFSPLQGGDRI